MDSISKETADNDRQDLETDLVERILELEKKNVELQKENQELIQKLLIENATSEVIKKVNSYFNEIISIGRTIAIPLLAIIGLAGVGGIWGIYSAMEERAIQTVDNYLKENNNKKMDAMIDQKIAPEVVKSINKDPKKAGEITQKVAEILPSQPEFINNLLGNQQFKASIQTSITMSSNTSPETKYYVVTGSSFTKNVVESDKETARNVKLNPKICISNSQPPAYLMVVAPQNNQDFQLDLNTAKKTLEHANTVPLFKKMELTSSPSRMTFSLNVLKSFGSIRNLSLSAIAYLVVGLTNVTQH